MMRSFLHGATLVAALASTGCYRMTITSGKVSTGGPVVDDRWRSTVVLDAVDIDGPLRLDGVCKGGAWARIEQVHSPLDWLVDVFLAGVVYESTHVDVYCAQPITPPPVAAPAVSPAPDPTPRPAPGGI